MKSIRKIIQFITTIALYIPELLKKIEELIDTIKHLIALFSNPDEDKYWDEIKKNNIKKNKIKNKKK